MSGLIFTFVMLSTINPKLKVCLLVVLVSHIGWLKLKESNTKRRQRLLEPSREQTPINSTKNWDGKTSLTEDGLVGSFNSLRNNLTPEYLKSPVPSPRPQLIATRSGIELPQINAKRDYYKNSFIQMRLHLE